MAESTARFVPISEAVRASGVTRSTILRWLKDPASTMRTDRNAQGAQTVFLSDVLARIGQAEQAGEDVELEESRPERIFAELVKALAAAQRHVENLLEPARKMAEAQALESATKSARILELEGQVRGMVDKYEQALSAEHERRMQEERERREQMRLDKALSMLVEFAPAAMAGVAGHFGLANVQEAVLVNSLGKLSDEQLRGIIAAGVLGPDALAVIERVRATRKQNGDKEKSAAAAGAAAAAAAATSKKPSAAA